MYAACLSFGGTNMPDGDTSDGHADNHADQNAHNHANASGDAHSPASREDASPFPTRPDGEARMLGALAHGLGICAPIIAPLVIWLVKKEELPAIDQPCKEALNFQLTFHGSIFLIGILTCIPSVVLPPLGCLIIPIYLLLGVIGLIALVLQIVATVAVYEGKPYRYPVNIRMV